MPMMCNMCGRQNIVGSLKIHSKQCKLAYDLKIQESHYDIKIQENQQIEQTTNDSINKTISIPRIIDIQNNDAKNKAFQACLLCAKLINSLDLATHSETCSNQISQGYLLQEQTLQTCLKCSRKFNSNRIYKHQDVCKGTTRPKGQSSQTQPDLNILQQSTINQTQPLYQSMVNLICYGCKEFVPIQDFKKHIVVCLECKINSPHPLLMDILEIPQPSSYLINIYNSKQLSKSSQRVMNSVKRDPSPKINTIQLDSRVNVSQNKSNSINRNQPSNNLKNSANSKKKTLGSPTCFLNNYSKQKSEDGSSKFLMHTPKKTQKKSFKKICTEKSSSKKSSIQEPPQTQRLKNSPQKQIRNNIFSFNKSQDNLEQKLQQQQFQQSEDQQKILKSHQNPKQIEISSKFHQGSNKQNMYQNQFACLKLNISNLADKRREHQLIKQINFEKSKSPDLRQHGINK